MIPIEFLRQFRIGEYAIFDFAVAFLGIYLLSPLLSKLFLKIKIDIPKKNWLYLTLPMGILAHILASNITPMTRDFLNIYDHYILKILILVLLILGLKNIKLSKT
jgi:ethanolamine transporter EutH